MESLPWPPAAALLAPLSPWFEAGRRALPWRALDLEAPHPDPYAVLVSELMLQQTQVATVIPYFQKWMTIFPDAVALAAAPEEAVHKAWEGLGYYRRARHLKAAATRITTAGWPTDLKGLLSLPGLGPYSAAAVGAIAFQWPEPALDGNAFRVLARLLALAGDPKAQAAELRTWLVPALQVHGPSRLTQALMELGATVCGPSPRCGSCPVGLDCLARQQGLQEVIPPPAQRAKARILSLHLVAVEAEGCLLLRTPTEKGLLAGLWTWPVVAPDHAIDLEPAAQPGLDLRTWPGWTQVYTHRREAVAPFHLRLKTTFPAPAGLTWVPVGSLTALAMGKRDDRLRRLLGEPGAEQPTLGEALGTDPAMPNPASLLAAIRALDGAPGR